ncbi:Uma2 family endonuclease [Geminocystis sp. GBBB08]|uniref:Uma2 family endonuclease n=1 Tax=Geminocystis sp. GBBB08 TaxID=2604140 RepID=UPI0027E324F8|nr:Uma2 family endonuclease [Geminocystis sp. GBBB08]MBL1209703.1 Uma2 family endonuclease [Geminocystis sp. GBBB08]
MITTLKTSLTLEEFLQQPETKPPQEFINGEILQKPMPQGEHSTIQSEFISTLNRIVKPKKIAYAFPELRCNFGGRSIIPDVVVFSWARIPRTEKGRIVNRFNTYPDWSIEILSPDQSYVKVLDNLLFCSEYGTQLGWLINPEEEIILVIFPEQKVKLFRGDDSLPVLENIDLKLTVNDVFNWLNIE